MPIVCRLLNPDDVRAVRALRIEALTHDPDAFLITAEDELKNTDDDWRTRLVANENQFIVGAFDGNTLVGMIGARREPWPKMRHTLDMWATYVSPTARGKGACRAMLEAQIAHARRLDGVACIKLGVIDGNVAALKSYESAGYVKFATEPMFMRIENGTIAAQHMMMRDLRT